MSKIDANFALLIPGKVTEG